MPKDWWAVNPETHVLIARYNSGKPMSRAPASTTQLYVPRVLGFMANYKAIV